VFLEAGIEIGAERFLSTRLVSCAEEEPHGDRAGNAAVAVGEWVNVCDSCYRLGRGVNRMSGPADIAA
jgi:hypothetical protein